MRATQVTHAQRSPIKLCFSAPPRETHFSRGDAENAEASSHRTQLGGSHSRAMTNLFGDNYRAFDSKNAMMTPNTIIASRFSAKGTGENFGTRCQAESGMTTYSITK